MPRKASGNINLFTRQKIRNPDGSISTVRSMSFGNPEGEVLVPTADQGRILSDDEAIKQYQTSGRHLGIFDTPDEATAYAKRLHEGYAECMFDVPLASSRKPIDPMQLSYSLRALKALARK